MKRYVETKFAITAATVSLLTCPLHACLNDRDSDTLEREGVDLPPIVQIVTGRFDRNPPRFYEMRLQRVARELKQFPERLNLYDDAAVACDRLGRSGEAVDWIEKKRARLPRYDAKNKSVREQWYRYHANIGTFLAHRWLSDGGDRAKTGEMEIASEHIRRAIEIKPNAHFGREKYQLMAMEWIIDPKQKGQSSPTNLLKLYPAEAEMYPGEQGTEHLEKLKLTDSVKGLTGLVVLGNAWESLDVFYALQAPLAFENKGSTLSLVRLRCRELVENGKVSLDPNASAGPELREIVAPSHGPESPYYNHEQMQEIYTRLRTEANEYQARRAAYMNQRLQAGQHPDTHPNFWKEWRDPGPPPAVPYTFWEKKGRGVLILGGALLASLVLLKGRRRQRRRTTPIVYQPGE